MPEMTDNKNKPRLNRSKEKPPLPKKPTLHKKPTVCPTVTAEQDETDPKVAFVHQQISNGGQNSQHAIRPAEPQPLPVLPTLLLQRNHGRLCQKNKKRKPSASDMSRLLELQEALRLNIEDFVNDLHIDCDLLGALYQLECLTDFDKQSIECRKTNNERARLLIVKIQNSAPDIIEKFLHYLNSQPIYEHLYKKTQMSLKKIEDGTLGVKCVICTMIETVDIRDIIDHLYQENVVSCCLYSDISELENPFCFRQYIWGQVLGGFNEYHKIIIDGISILKTALGTKYAHIAKMLDKLPTTEIICCCVRRRGLQKRPSSSFYKTASDCSTTSEVISSFGDIDA